MHKNPQRSVLHVNSVLKQKEIFISSYDTRSGPFSADAVPLKLKSIELRSFRGQQCQPDDHTCRETSRFRNAYEREWKYRGARDKPKLLLQEEQQAKLLDPGPTT